MANIKDWLLHAEKQTGETIEAIVVGRHYNDFDSTETIYPIFSREDGLAALDAEFDSGYGGEDCHRMYAWSKSWVFFIYAYDGATCLAKLPARPLPCEPKYGGG